jgi:hypothetical protein
MNTSTRPQPDKASLASRLILLVMVASVIDVNYQHHRVLDRIEILFQATRSDIPSTALFVSRSFPRTTYIKDQAAHIHQQHCHAVPPVPQNTGRVNRRGFYSLHIISWFYNIPHQNADDADAFVHLPDVA